MEHRDKHLSLADPPSMLTDRGAYCNFLEVQLERVSAVCLTVTSYDERFNDMQSLIVNLEEKLQLNTKLLGLNQKCTDELREDFKMYQQKTEENTRSSNSAFQKDVSNIFSELTSVHVHLNSLHTFVQNIEEKLSFLHDTFQNTSVSAEKEITAMKDDVGNLFKALTALETQVNATTTLVSKNEFAVKELADKTQNQISASQENINGVMRKLREEMLQKLVLAESRQQADSEKCHQHIISQELTTLAAIRKYKENSEDDVLSMISSATKKLAVSIRAELRESEKNNAKDMENIRKALSALEERESGVEHMTAAHFDSFLEQLEGLQQCNSAQDWEIALLKKGLANLQDSITIKESEKKEMINSTCSELDELNNKLEEINTAKTVGKVVGAKKLNARTLRKKPLFNQKGHANSAGALGGKPQIGPSREKIVENNHQSSARDFHLEAFLDLAQREREETRRSLDRLSSALFADKAEKLSSDQRNATLEVTPSRQRSHEAYTAIKTQ